MSDRREREREREEEGKGRVEREVDSKDLNSSNKAQPLKVSTTSEYCCELQIKPFTHFGGIPGPYYNIL
jgi:hypothetical protein